MTTRIQYRRGTAAQWATANPVLAAGEPGVVIPGDQMKVGDGVTAWNDLPYMSGPAGAAGAQGPAGADGTDGTDGFAARQETEIVTTSLAQGANWTGTVTLKPGYRLLKIQTDVPARVRVYDSTTSRTNDTSRPAGTDPTGAHGVILDFLTTAVTLTWWLNPVVDGYTTDGTDTVPLLVTNLAAGTNTVTVTLTWTRSE